MQGRPQLPDSGQQAVLLFPQGVQLFLFAVEPGAEDGGLPQDVDLRCTLLIPEVRNLSLQFLEEVLQPDSPLSFHVVVQVAFLEGFLLFGRFRRPGDRLSGDPLLLAPVLVVTVLAAAVILAGPLARVRYTARGQRRVRTGDARRRGRGQIVGRVSVRFARAGLIGTGRDSVVVRCVFCVRVPAPMMVRRIALRVLTDLECHSALDVALVAGSRIRRQVLLAYRDDVDLFVLGIRGGLHAQFCEVVPGFGSRVTVVPDVGSLVFVGRRGGGRRRRGTHFLVVGVSVPAGYAAAFATTSTTAVGIGVGVGVQLFAVAVVAVAAFHLLQIVQQIREGTDLARRAGHARPQTARLGVLQLFPEQVDDPMGGWVVVVALVVSVVSGASGQTQSVRSDGAGGQVDVVFELWRIFV